MERLHSSCAVVHAYNCSTHETTGVSPYLVMFGREPRLPVDVQFCTSISEIQSTKCSDFIAKLQDSLSQAFELVASRTKSSQSRKAKYFNKWTHGVMLHVGDKVLVRKVGTHICDKLADKWEEDIYTVIEHPY